MTVTAETPTAQEKPLADQLSAKAWILKELIACEAQLKEARTKTEDQPQVGAPVTTPGNLADLDTRCARAYGDLESDIHDLRNMASIAESLFAAAVEGASCKDGWRTVKMTEEESDRLEFAFYRVKRMAADLCALYLKAFEGRHS